jgi:hypothetical protein
MFVMFTPLKSLLQFPLRWEHWFLSFDRAFFAKKVSRKSIPCQINFDVINWTKRRAKDNQVLS